MTDVSDVFQNALALGLQDRASLAKQLLASLDEIGPDELERLWENQAQTRLDEYRSGSARTIGSDEVHQKVKRILE